MTIFQVLTVVLVYLGGIAGSVLFGRVFGHFADKYLHPTWYLIDVYGIASACFSVALGFLYLCGYFTEPQAWAFSMPCLSLLVLTLGVVPVVALIVSIWLLVLRPAFFYGVDWVDRRLYTPLCVLSDRVGQRFFPERKDDERH